jgi:drug/metabolite transporter (DMT)-like permease
MTPAIAYAVAAMICYGIVDFIYKRAASAGIRADHFLMGQAWFFFPLMVIYAFATHTLVVDVAALWGCLAGIFVFIGLYYFVRSLVSGAVGINASIFRLNFIVTASLAIAILGEPLTAAKAAGLLLALAATWLLVGAGQPGKHADGGAQRRSLVDVSVATVAFGASNFFHTVGLRHGVQPETMAVAQALIFMPLATTVVFSVDRKLPPRATFKYGAVAAIFLLAATILFLRGVALGQASILVPIAQMGFIVTAALGIVFLREGITVRKLLGLAAAASALAVLAAS